jgi:tetratricopeptide (TPR) repeat protein
VRKAKSQIRIIAQLIDATTGGHLWAEHYNHSFKDIFAVQDEIVQKIVTTLKLHLTVQERGYLARKTTNNLEAYDTLLRGVELFARTTKETNVQARQMFEQAVALDPQYAEAYAWLGGCYLADWIWRWNADPQSLERASALAYQALALNDSLPRAYSILSNVYAQKQQYEQAIAEGVRAIALDPNNDFSCNRQGAALNWAGRPAEALPLMEQAIRLNPHYPPFYLGDLGWTYNLIGRHTEAVTTLKEAVSRGPTLMVYYFILANSYMQQWAAQQEADAHTLAHALAAAQQALTLNNAFPRGYSALGSVYLWRKQYEQALVAIERAITLDPNTADGYARLAEALSRTGKSREGVRMAEQALHCKSDIVDLHLNSVGAAYYFAGKPAEAVTPLQQYLTRYPNILSAHLTLAAVYSELGKETAAQAEATEVLRLNSTFSLEVHKERAPIREPATLERHLTALRKAGLK